MSMLSKITQKIIGNENMNDLKYYGGIRKYKYLKKYKNTKKIIYLLVPHHGNIGDQAIVYATIKFFNDKFKDYKLLEFYRDDIYDYGYSIKKILNKDDIIILQGGGNIGNLYIKEEITRRFVLNKFKGNKIISMPQTMYFTNDEEGNLEKIKTKNIYSNIDNLLLLAREDKSYIDMKSLFQKNKVLEVPDIVFYLEDLFKESNDRDGVLVCLRSDKESIYKDKKKKFIEEINNHYKKVTLGDTVVNRFVDKEDRKDELFNLWNQFRSSKVVITDRLHGMLFSVITKTPCIVLRSLDYKVIGTYEWIKDLNYVQFVDDLDSEKIIKLIDELSNLSHLDNTNFKEKYFSDLASKLKEHVGIYN